MLLLCVMFLDPIANRPQYYECTDDLFRAQESIEYIESHGQVAWIESDGV